MIQIGVPPTTLENPVEHLIACHRRIEQRLDALLNAASYLAERPAASLATIGNSLQFLDTSGALHTADEEESLFPRLRPKLSPADESFVSSLEGDHRKADSLYAQLKALTVRLSAEPGNADLIEAYRERAGELRTLYRRHISSEDAILAKLARELLTQEELREISREMVVRRSSRNQEPIKTL